MIPRLHTFLEYKDDTDLIPRSTSVIVRRMPPAAPGKGTAQRYIKGVMGVVGGVQMATDRGGHLGGRIEPAIASGNASGTRKFGHQTLVNVPKPATASTTAATTTTNTTMNNAASMKLPNEEESEEMRIKAMFQQEEEQWQQQQARMADAAPIFKPGQRPRGNNPTNGSGGTNPSGGSGGAATGANGARAFQAYPDREPPPNYVCYRCGEKGHFINHCPTNGDPAFDRPRLRRTTGIPKSFLKAIDKPTDKKSGVMVTDVGGFVVATPDSNAWEKHVAMHRAAVTAGDVHERTDAPPELSCVICKGLMRDAVSTPCCDAQGCEECLSKTLRENNMTCTQCGAPEQSVDLLVPNYRLRDAVDQYLRQQTVSTGSNVNDTAIAGGGGNGQRVQDREATGKSGHTQGKRIATLMTDQPESNQARSHRGQKRDHYNRPGDVSGGKPITSTANNNNTTTAINTSTTNTPPTSAMGVNLGLPAGFPPHHPPPLLNPMNPVMRSLMMIPPTVPGAPPPPLPPGFPAGFMPPPPGFPFGILPPMPPPPGMLPLLGEQSVLQHQQQHLQSTTNEQEEGEAAADGTSVTSMDDTMETTLDNGHDKTRGRRNGNGAHDNRRSRSPSGSHGRHSKDDALSSRDRSSMGRRRDTHREREYEHDSSRSSRDRNHRDEQSSTARHRAKSLSKEEEDRSHRHRSHPYQRSKSRHT
ncbi:hypothetical protein BDF19DRAFT_452841 [Syncephalis fuscata]|nr:hypothetical protein BDF19DRAFT_452841 [Syncephalis fuscata]